METLTVGMAEPAPLYGTVDQAAHRFGVSKRTLYRLAAQGKIRLGHAGRRTLVAYDSVERLIRGETQHAA